MKKNRLLFFMLPFLCIFFCLSCIDNDYDIDGINKDFQIGGEGFIFPIGDIERFDLGDYIDDYIDIDPIEKTIDYEHIVSDVISEDFFDYFTYEFAGEESAIGSIILECTIVARFEDPDTKPTLSIDSEVLNPHGSTWSLMNKSSFTDKDTDDLKKGAMLAFEMSQDDIVAMKNEGASKLRFVFRFKELQKTQLSTADFIELKNVKIKSTGGVMIK